MLTFYDREWIKDTIEEKLNNFCEEMMYYIKEYWNGYDDEEIEVPDVDELDKYIKK